MSAKINTTIDAIQLTVIFISALEDLADIKVINGTQHSSNVAQTYQKPSTFSVGFGSRVTPPLSVDGPMDNVSSEISNLFVTTCHMTGKGNVYFVNNYDDVLSHRFRTIDRTFEPFCGRRSLRKPGFVFRSNFIPGDGMGHLDPVKMTSFGYRYVSQ